MKESGPGYQTGNASEAIDEPGAVENRLSLDPTNDAWADTIGNWDDGEEYTVEVKVRQISPGEFEVLEATPKEEAEEEEQPAPKKRYSNPAIANLET